VRRPGRGRSEARAGSGANYACQCEAASVGGLFHIRPDCDVACWAPKQTFTVVRSALSFRAIRNARVANVPRAPLFMRLGYRLLKTSRE
jgi:hypothetical protein